MLQSDEAPLARNGFIPYEAMNPEDATRLREMVRRADRSRQTPDMLARQEFVRRNPVRYGITSQVLPHGAVAMLVLDSNSPWPRTVILSAELATDGSLALADAALRREEGILASSPNGRVLLVRSDKRVVTTGGDPAPGGALNVHQPNSGSRSLVRRLVEAAAGAPVVTLAGVEARFPS
jgi:hypothetical protein